MLASTKDGPVIELLALWIGLGRPFERKRLPLAPGTVRRLVFVHGAQFLAQYFADIAGQAHVALGRLHAGALGGVLVEVNRGLQLFRGHNCLPFYTLSVSDAVLFVSVNGNPARLFHSSRGVQHLDGDDVARRVIVEDDTRLFFVALGHGDVAEDHGERVRLGVVFDFHAGSSGKTTSSGFTSSALRLRISMPTTCPFPLKSSTTPGFSSSDSTTFASFRRR